MLAIHRACKVVPGLHQRRRFCPELTVANLAGDGENGFIPLILQLMPDDLETDLNEPKHILHPLVDEYLLHDDPYGAGKYDRQVRNHLITITIYQLYAEFVHLLLSFHLSWG